MSSQLDPDDVIALNRLATVARALPGAAHDVNNALQIIGGSAELLEGQGTLSDPARRALHRIRAQSARAAALLEDLMRFTRDPGDGSARVSLKEVASRAAALRGVMIRRAGISLQFDAASSPAGEITGSFAALQQVVLNLIMNAEQSLVGRKGGKIMLALSEEAGEAVLRTVDNGPGLSESIQGRAFDPLATTRPVPFASGLGLPAARLIARAHGGDVHVETVAEGCCATLRLPLATPV